MNSLLKSKKGVALESAILFLIVVFTFCFLLTSVAVLGTRRERIDRAKNNVDLVQEQITEDFLSYVKSADGTTDFTEYVAEKGYDVYNFSDSNNGDDYTLTVTRKSDGEKAFELKANKSSDGTVKLLYCKTSQ